MADSNRRPSACKADALPVELILRGDIIIIFMLHPEMLAIFYYFAFLQIVSDMLNFPQLIPPVMQIIIGFF